MFMEESYIVWDIDETSVCVGFSGDSRPRWSGDLEELTELVRPRNHLTGSELSFVRF